MGRDAAVVHVGVPRVRVEHRLHPCLEPAGCSWLEARREPHLDRPAPGPHLGVVPDGLLQGGGDDVRWRWRAEPAVVATSDRRGQDRLAGAEPEHVGRLVPDEARGARPVVPGVEDETGEPAHDRDRGGAELALGQVGRRGDLVSEGRSGDRELVAVAVDPAGVVVREWMKSQGHRDNILDTRFVETGIGVFVGPDRTVYFTQIFLRRTQQ